MEILKEIGIKNEGGKLTSAKPMEIEELQDETGFACMSCQEGYTFKPDSILGFYTFTKRVNMNTIPLITGANRQESGYGTVTHLNFIHFSCHRDATKAERTMKVPKEEWEGATLRNSQTKCNNLFPVQGPKVSDDAYSQSVEKYWGNAQRIAKTDAPRFRVLAHDFKFLLLRFAKEESFSTDSKGGGRESNIKSIPFLIQMGLFLLDQKGAAQRRVFEKALSQFLAQGPDEWAAAGMQVDNVLYQLILSLHLHSLEEWKVTRFIFFKRVLMYTQTEVEAVEKHEKATGKTEEKKEEKKEDKKEDKKEKEKVNDTKEKVPEEEKKEKDKVPDVNPDTILFKRARPFLIYFTLIDKMQMVWKKSSGIQPENIGLVSHKIEEPWIIDLKNHIKNEDIKSVEEIKEILSAYEDFLLNYENFSEFFDDIGLLPQITGEEKDVEQWAKKFMKQESQK